MLNPDFRDALSAFDAERVEYLVVGAFALAAHGLPRATGDIDLWVRPTAENAERVWRALVAFGAPGELFERTDFATPDRVVQIEIPPSRLDVLTTIDGVEVPIIGRRHLLRNKRAAGRHKDLGDIDALGESPDED
jgi:hypothetical protein